MIYNIYYTYTTSRMYNCDLYLLAKKSHFIYMTINVKFVNKELISIHYNLSIKKTQKILTLVLLFFSCILVPPVAKTRRILFHVLH